MVHDTDAPLVHAPVRPPREGFPRERVYAGRWQKLMQARSGVFARILGDYRGRIGQREAAVAASVVTWLGTNIGQAMLEDAQLRCKSSHRQGWPSGLAASDAHLCAWVHENKRKAGINSGIRTLEAILWSASQEAWAPVSAEDYEVAEHVMFWLGQHDGTSFVAACQTECKALEQLHSLGSFMRSGLMDLAPAQELLKNVPQYQATGEVAASVGRKLLDQLASQQQEQR